MAKIKDTFVELTPYYFNGENSDNIQIDVNFKKWLRLVGLTKKQYQKLVADEGGDELLYYLNNDYYAKEILRSPKKYGVYQVYVSADDKKFFEEKGIKLKKMSNTLFLEVRPQSYDALADIEFVRTEY